MPSNSAALLLLAAASAALTAPGFALAMPAAVQGGPAGNGAAAAVPLIQEEGDFYLLTFDESPDGMDLEKFVKVCQEATGRNFMIAKDAGDALRQNKVRMFGPKRIPKQDFYPFFQILMFINDFACVEVGPPHLAVIVIQGIGQTGRAPNNQNILAKPIYILPEELPLYEDQPAVLVRTLLHLPNTDVRQLTNSLRTILPQGQTTESLINAGNSNTVILTGFGSNVAALARLLQLVDEASRVDTGPEPVFDMVPLVFASADDVADVLDQLLEARTKAIETARRSQPVPAEAGAAGGQRVQTESKILVDKRTNSLIVMAMPDELPGIKDLIARLDVDVIEPERNYHIYALENVKAEDMQKVLDDFLQDASRLEESGTGAGGRPPTAGATSGGSSNEVVVVQDESTNSLLIAANKTRYEEIVELIRQLDRRQDQVLIETALIELTGQSLTDIGVELGFANIPGADSTGGFGVTNFGLSTFEPGPDGVPIKTPSVLSGITGGILEGDDFALPILLRAVQERDDTNVLNIPSVLVKNNGSARVVTKDEQPTTTVTAFGGSGVGGQTQENFNGYQEAGITLLISPSISASRYLRLGVELTVSNFIGTFSGAIPPPRITREISTQVNVPDGDTMVIGGIISDNLQESQTGTPWLSDIPILGQLFSRNSRSTSRTTLYFFVTPHILRDRDFADLAELSYKKKLDASEVIRADRLKLIDPSFGEAAQPGSLQGFEIPIYKSPARGEVDSEAVGLDPAKQSKLLEEQAATETP